MGIKIIAQNKKAFHDYFILETYEAGLVLVGSEVKSLRDAKVQLKDSYVFFKNGELFLSNCHISVYAASSYMNHDPERHRKLLMHRQEISKVISAIQEKGLTVVPTKIYFKEGRVKIEIGLAKGKKAYDKRESSKKREQNLELDRARRHSR